MIDDDRLFVCLFFLGTQKKITLIDFRISGQAAKTSTADVTKQNVWNDVGKRDARQTDAKRATLNDRAFCTLNVKTKG